jgi:hypothetical protein
MSLGERSFGHSHHEFLGSRVDLPVNEAGRITGGIATQLQAIPLGDAEWMRHVVATRERTQERQAAQRTRVGQHGQIDRRLASEREARQAEHVTQNDATSDAPHFGVVQQLNALGK